MSKAKEYYNKICHESNLWDEKNSKKLANKTLEDVKKLIKKYRQHLFHGDDRFDGMLSELEKLKL